MKPINQPKKNLNILFYLAVLCKTNLHLGHKQRDVITTNNSKKTDSRQRRYFRQCVIIIILPLHVAFPMLDNTDQASPGRPSALVQYSVWPPSLMIYLMIFLFLTGEACFRNTFVCPSGVRCNLEITKKSVNKTSTWHNPLHWLPDIICLIEQSTVCALPFPYLTSKSVLGSSLNLQERKL
jgi:hypothetical protein